MLNLMSSEFEYYDLIVIGAGLSGLAAAQAAEKLGKRVCILEKNDHVGGRVRSLRQDGFILDKGFQVYLNAYPTASKLLDHKQLELEPFDSGARILNSLGKIDTLAHPFKHPKFIFQSLKSKLFNSRDILALSTLFFRLKTSTTQQLFNSPDISSSHFLEKTFSKKLISHFFEPFFKGVFLDSKLKTSSRLLLYYLKMFINGYACLPKAGMQAIPNQLKNTLKTSKLYTNCTVKHIHKHHIQLLSGKQFKANTILLAMPKAQISDFFYQADKTNQGVWTSYFVTEKKLNCEHKLLTLNGSKQGVINHLCVLDHIQPSYAPRDKSLVSVTVLDSFKQLDKKTLTETVKSELPKYLNSHNFEHLKSFWIDEALPTQTFASPSSIPLQLSECCFATGDWQNHGSIEGAIQAGLDSIAWLNKEHIFNLKRN